MNLYFLFIFIFMIFTFHLSFAQGFCFCKGILLHSLVKVNMEVSMAHADLQLATLLPNLLRLQACTTMSGSFFQFQVQKQTTEDNRPVRMLVLTSRSELPATWLVKDYSFSELLLSPGLAHLAILIFDLCTHLHHYWENEAQGEKNPH